MTENDTDNKSNPILVADPAPATGYRVYGDPGVMKSEPVAGQVAEDPTAPKRMVGADRGRERHLVGRTIKEVRLMTVNEQVAEGWMGRGACRPAPPMLAIVLDDGTSIYSQSPMRVRRTDGTLVPLEEEK